MTMRCRSSLRLPQPSRSPDMTATPVLRAGDGSRSHIWAGTALRAIELTLSALGGALLLLLLGLVITSVASRYFGIGSVHGSDELSTWLFISLIFVGFPLVAGGSLAMKFDLISSRLTGLPRAFCNVLGHGVVINTSLFLVASSLTIMRDMGGISPVLGLPEWWRFALAPVAGIVGVITVLLQMLALRQSLVSVAASLILGLAVFALSDLHGLAFLETPSLAAGLIAFVVLMLGAPLPHALITALAVVVPLGSLLPQAAVLQTAIAGVSSFLLLAIPFFLLAGALMLTGGLAHRLVRLADTLVGHKKGGLAQTTLLTNVFFSGISGSSLADAAFGAKVMMPGLVARGYPRELAAAIVASTAVLPNIIPPSVAFLMLAIATNLSIGSLFVGGLVGGLFVAAVLSFTLRLVAPDVANEVKASSQERRSAIRGAAPVLGLAVIILLGIRLGVVTTTEASALAAAYSLVLTWVYLGSSKNTVSAIWKAFMQAAREASAVGLLVAATAPFTFLLAVDQVPLAINALFQSIGNDPFTFLLVANIFLLIVGCPLEIGVAILLFGPLLLPAAVSAGIDPIFFGVLFVINLMIGGLTPPVGSLVFVTAGISGLSAGKVFYAALPFVGALIISLVVMSVATGIWAII